MSTEKSKMLIIEEKHLDAFERYLYERENAEATIRKYRSDAGTFLRYLGNDRRIDKSRVLAYKERIDEVFDPELAVNRAVDYYRSKRIWW